MVAQLGGNWAGMQIQAILLQDSCPQPPLCVNIGCMESLGDLIHYMADDSQIDISSFKLVLKLQTHLSKYLISFISFFIFRIFYRSFNKLHILKVHKLIGLNIHNYETIPSRKWTCLEPPKVSLGPQGSPSLLLPLQATNDLPFVTINQSAFSSHIKES